MVRIACDCGWFWRNEFLKGKTDAELEYETEAAFERHVIDIRDAGF